MGAPTGEPGSVTVIRPLLVTLWPVPSSEIWPSSVPLLTTVLFCVQEPQAATLKPRAPARTVPLLVKWLSLPSSTPVLPAPTLMMPLLVMTLSLKALMPTAASPAVMRPVLVMVMVLPSNTSMPRATVKPSGSPEPTTIVPLTVMVLSKSARMPATSPSTALPIVIVPVLLI